MADPISRQFEEITQEVLRRLDVTATVSVTEEDSGLRAEIISDESPLLIGWRGQTLAALEYLVRILMMHTVGPEVHLPELHIDAGGYRQHQTDELVELAKKAAETVQKSGNSEILRPMNAFERRVVHMALAEMTHLTTESIGIDPNRRIIIKPKI